ncbi:MAG: Rho termination factor N-terminal domain-containing protein [Rothia sp. (in: high G+C Gram-positive bacteria)]|nr:Rho termination factor N-terminal domain-containing protein [Rothia sp. (in: high G+C Gram-positive bacteria)]
MGKDSKQTTIKLPKSVKRSSEKVQEIFTKAAGKHFAKHDDPKKAKKAGKKALKKKGYTKDGGAWVKADQKPVKAEVKKTDKKVDKKTSKKSRAEKPKGKKAESKKTEPKKPKKKAAKKKAELIDGAGQLPTERLADATESYDVETLMGEDIPDENMFSSAEVENEPEIDLGDLEEQVDGQDAGEQLDEVALAEFDRELEEDTAELVGQEEKSSASALDAFTRAELYTQATELQIRGRSRMTKQQLFEAIEAAEA